MPSVTKREIEGKFNTAICYAHIIDDIATAQIKTMCDYEFMKDSKIRIMPDVHAGKGCTIGTTMTIADKVVPSFVGVDIGCGMYTVSLGKINLDLPALDGAVHKVPSGMDVWPEKQEPFDLTRLRCYNNLKNPARFEKSLGTLGGGNHFIEIDQDDEENKYLVIHSGSRNLGKQVAEHYKQTAVDQHMGIGIFQETVTKLIADYKAAGKADQIQKALDELKSRRRQKQTDLPEDLCYVYGQALVDYLHDIEICQEFARRNRELMALRILDEASLKGIDGFHTIHNYIDTKEMILRKGAISARKGERVLIPLNMRDGSIMAMGRGNPDWNYSAPHGAGRVMSRKQAKSNITIEEFRESMTGIYSTSVNEETIDEAPMAYKGIDDIIDVVQDSVDIIKILKPIYNFKAIDMFRPKHSKPLGNGIIGES